MEAFNRKTEYWITPTPSKVGPGSYNVSPDREHRQISAPFVSNQVRSLNNSIQKNNEPGPGSYGKITDWKHDKNNRGIGFTSLPREIKYPNKHGVLTAISAGVSPGPGSYATLEAPQKRPKIQQRTKPVSLVLEPTSVSIPTKIAVEQPLGPYSYTPNYSKIKPCVITSDFSLSKTERNELFQTNEIPGPGQYENKEIRTNKVGWAFRSKVKRKSMDTIESPGPAAYSPQLNDFHTNSLYSCFGTTADRNMPVSNDPHRPYICGNKAGPPVGAYEKDSKKIERKILKPRFSQTLQEKAKIGFNVTEKRELKLAQNEFVPGPGNYELSKDEQDAKSIIFSCHSARFKDNKNPESPGPGSYENPNGN